MSDQRLMTVPERIVLNVIAHIFQELVDSMYVDAYSSDQREYERDLHLKTHLDSMADHVKEMADGPNISTDIDLSYVELCAIRLHRSRDKKI